jgi:hypothetical protein
VQGWNAAYCALSVASPAASTQDLTMTHTAASRHPGQPCRRAGAYHRSRRDGGAKHHRVRLKINKLRGALGRYQLTQPSVTYSTVGECPVGAICGRTLGLCIRS